MNPTNLSRRTFVVAAAAATSLATLTIRPLGAAQATTAPTTSHEAERAHHTLLGLL